MKNYNYLLHCGRRREPKYHRSIVWIFAVTIISVILSWLIQLGVTQIKTVFAEAQMSQGKSVLIANLAAENTQLQAKIPVQKTYTQQEIESYIKTIFGPAAETAIKISHHECGTWSKQYPACLHISDKEYSVGVFQINLYNAKQWIHASRIPGDTITQKVEWLKNPLNNTLYAFWIYQTSGWNPWSTYISGSYLK